jgi:hypothetical protein
VVQNVFLVNQQYTVGSGRFCRNERVTFGLESQVAGKLALIFSEAKRSFLEPLNLPSAAVYCWLMRSGKTALRFLNPGPGSLGRKIYQLFADGNFRLKVTVLPQVPKVVKSHGKETEN